MCSRKVVLHNAQIDKTVMIHIEACIQPRAVLLWGIASHLEVGLMQADKPGLGLKEPRGVDLTMCSPKKSTTQCPNGDSYDTRLLHSTTTYSTLVGALLTLR
jgi:hypothetical protein